MLIFILGPILFWVRTRLFIYLIFNLFIYLLFIILHFSINNLTRYRRAICRRFINKIYYKYVIANR